MYEGRLSVMLTPDELEGIRQLKRAVREQWQREKPPTGVLSLNSGCHYCGGTLTSPHSKACLGLRVLMDNVRDPDDPAEQERTRLLEYIAKLEAGL